MPRKIRELIGDLRRAGFVSRPGKGDHTYWTHPEVPTAQVSLDGKPGADAKRYQEQQVRQAIAQVERRLAERREQERRQP